MLPAIGHLILALSSVPVLVAAIPGVPEPPRPGPLPGYWASWANDAFGGEVGDNPDDFRTNSLSVGITHGPWIGRIDLSALTDKQDGLTRTDELTISIGRMLSERRDDTGDFLLSAGLGVRTNADFGGGTIQNRWHDVIEFPRVELRDEEPGIAGTAWMNSHWLWLSEVHPPFTDTVFRDGSRLGFALGVSALGSTAGEIQGEMSGSLVWAGHDGVLWAGLRQALRGSTALGATAEAVAQAEAGSWFLYGFSVGAWYFSGGMHLESSLSSGRIGWMFDRPPIHHRIGSDIFTTEIGGTVTSYGINTVVRWRPYWMRLLKDDGRTSLYVDYRFGRVPGVGLHDASARYQQGNIGIDVALRPPRDGLQWNPFAYSGIGWRQEAIQHEGPDPRFPEVDANGAMVQGGLGMRLTFGDRPHAGRGVQYGLTTSYDVWTNLDRDQATSDDGSGATLTQLATESAVSLRLIIAIGW